jgi:hypothetical protein
MVCVRPARSRTFADQWPYEVRILLATIRGVIAQYVKEQIGAAS